ncbi:hypothetical protein ASPVEDRAFT_24271 [Aspergillus versicolor CBS 583.65]|uniref:Uncharacterized protein n=1 Tax=Aspergillus versicolor CBS 583.65 TaxID=1036611 RepID=A0A1L9P746_ASPVE|nr:uncharacterized protein ASPVEDRAFT_24271 [Aspergillus versicolor CBS 583.65]OJI97306.1 hypothetical protein ASPVEDRAFT_24271 [Aspergillus versicolor CBS 583.65]
MDNVPQKRPQQHADAQSVSSRPITLPKRPRSDNSAQHIVTSNGGRELSASSAVNARKASSAAHHSGDDDDEEDDEDYTSSSGSSLSSSDDDDDDGDDDDDAQSETAGNSNNVVTGDNEGITSLPARRKPNIRRIDQEPSLLSKLSAFLPQMKTANEDLQREIAAGRAKDIRLDEGDENEAQSDGQYIEMNLGLGVLEEKRPGDEPTSGDEEKDSEPHGHSDTNLMDRLMGKEKTSSSEKPSIQDLGN